LIGILISVPFSWAMQALLDGVPFLERMTLTFAVVSLAIIIVSILENKKRAEGKKSDMPFIIGLCLTIVVISVPAGFRILFGDIDASSYLGVAILGISGLIFALLIGENKEDDSKGIDINTSLFKTENVFNLSAIAVCIILAIIYYSLW
jgi:hypothetical protein